MQVQRPYPSKEIDRPPRQRETIDSRTQAHASAWRCSLQLRCTLVATGQSSKQVSPVELAAKLRKSQLLLVCAVTWLAIVLHFTSVPGSSPTGSHLALLALHETTRIIPIQEDPGPAEAVWFPGQ